MRVISVKSALRYGMLLSALTLVAVNQCSAAEWEKDIRKDCFSSAPSPAPEPGGAKHHPLIACIADLFSDSPLHLTVGSLVPGTSLGGGLALNQDFSSGGRERTLTATAVYTVTGSWGVNASFLFEPTKHGCIGSLCPAGGDRFNVELYGARRELTPLDFFGLGPTSGSTAFSFGLRESIGGAQASIPFVSWAHFVTVVENRKPEVARSSDPLSLRANFNEATAPGISHQPDFMRYSNFVQVHNPKEPPYFQTATIGYTSYQDLEEGHYSFGQFFVNGEFLCDSKSGSSKSGKPSSTPRGWCKNGEMRLCECGTVTLRAYLKNSHTASGQSIPFYYEPTLGGSDFDNVVTLRGYPNYRFRDPDLVLYQFEYEKMLAGGSPLSPRPSAGSAKAGLMRQIGEVLWGATGALAFYDAGTVGTQMSDLGFSQLRQDAGVGIEVRAANTVLAQAYVAMGAGHGAQIGYQLKKLF